MDKYDGWVIKVAWPGRPPYLLTWTFRQKRTEVVKAFEDNWSEPWRTYRRNGSHKIVKVKFTEVA